MKVFLDFKDEEKNMSAPTVKELLEKLDLNPTTVLVTRNGELLTEEAVLKENDIIKILSVISGG